MHHVQPRIQGVSPELRELYAGIEASTIGHLCEEGYVHGLLPLARPIRLIGNAVTVKLPAVDGSAIRPALIASQPGDVLVIEMAAGDEHRACWGELRTLAAIKKQLAGAVISGCVTDVRALSELGFPVFSRAVSALTTRALDTGGQVNVPVTIAGVQVRPGDLVVGDDDGLFVLDPAAALEIGHRAHAKQREEAARRLQLR
ncbi:Regulator of RNase E activity RraA [Duganella sp. CF458]|uniref:RraA family protein n=1 Tax=Duganella sp. CF458 TaxID=1884368 RepID=UPI0008E37793|nr:RraA family protein [Duganella sp. CF458]SFG44147.1 Regulator of RNase E activity RraA [Duganella sp. CF458]